MYPKLRPHAIYPRKKKFEIYFTMKIKFHLYFHMNLNIAIENPMEINEIGLLFFKQTTNRFNPMTNRIKIQLQLKT